jgi:hypothetical protein
MIKFSALILALATLLQAATPSDTCKQETWITDREVDAIAQGQGARHLLRTPLLTCKRESGSAVGRERIFCKGTEHGLEGMGGGEAPGASRDRSQRGTALRMLDVKPPVAVDQRRGRLSIMQDRLVFRSFPITAAPPLRRMTPAPMLLVYI